MVDKLAGISGKMEGEDTCTNYGETSEGVLSLFGCTYMYHWAMGPGWFDAVKQ